MLDLSDVEIEYHEYVPPQRTAPEFYVEGHGFNTLATIKRGNREIHVAANGEMHLTIPMIDSFTNEPTDEGATVVRYASDLKEVGINDDIQLWQFVKTISNAGYEVYRMNPWWEIYADHDPDGIVSDSDNFYEAVDIATALLFDDEYWAAEELVDCE